MGIQGLHKGLSFATRKTNVGSFRGQTIAVDSSSWLHRSVYSVSEKYVEAIERGRIDPHCVQVSAKYITARCRELLGCFGIAKIVLVMDGKRCPLKADTNVERERKRQDNLKEARDYIRKGRRDKAEEKYKSCIKVKDGLTNAVMAQLKRNFQKDSRVSFVWSPYEADAQLVKLCHDRVADAVVTEDSDVLVYSATLHYSVPVIFKLDRGTGKCDVCSMDWLLTPQTETATSNKKPGSTLETILRSLAARQVRTPGLGVRLFVQGCMLAGSDYSPNSLSGIGLVNAFKYVRDNAFRDDSIRFAKVLDAMPKKIKTGVDTTQYELTLAKSEAVFYYHMVRHKDNSVQPLSELCMSDANTSGTMAHAPSVARFEGDISFLGQFETPGSSGSRQNPPVTAVFVPSVAAKRLEATKHPWTSKPKKAQKRATPANPYLARKRPRASSRTPLQEVDLNRTQTSRQAENPFSQYAVGSGGTSSSYLDKREDVRFVKRKFPTESDQRPKNPTLKLTSAPSKGEPPARSSLFQHLNSKNCQNERPQSCQQETSPATKGPPKQLYDTNPVDTVVPAHTHVPDFFDLTEPQAHSDESSDADAVEWPQPARVSLESYNAGPSKVNTDLDIPSPRSSPPIQGRHPLSINVDDDSIEACDNVSEPASTSRYFGINHSRRVTLDRPRKRTSLDCSDDATRLSGLDEPTVPLHSNVSQVQSPGVFPDEGIDSPTEGTPPFLRLTATSAKKETSRKLDFSRVLQPFRPLESAFRKQVEMSQARKSPDINPMALLESKSRSLPCKVHRNSVKSYFPPLSRQPSAFKQLPLSATQTEEEFLWNTP